MATGPSLQAIEPPPRSAERPTPFSPHVVAVVVGWFFGWPVVVFACLPWVMPGDTLAACLLGAGTLLWFVSCYGICGILLVMVETRWRSYPQYRRIVVGWFFGWFPLYFGFGHLVSLIGHVYWIDLSLFILGTILWLASCYGVYDMLFTMAEARWPVAKPIREMVRFLFRMLLASRGHHSP